MLCAKFAKTPSAPRRNEELIPLSFPGVLATLAHLARNFIFIFARDVPSRSGKKWSVKQKIVDYPIYQPYICSLKGGDSAMAKKAAKKSSAKKTTKKTTKKKK